MSFRLDIATRLKSRLIAKRCPIQDVALDDRTETVTGARERIVLERDLDAPDTFASVRGQHVNPKHKLTRSVPLKLTIYAQSTKAGAMSFEHEGRMDSLVDTVLASLDDVLRGDLQVSWQPTSGRSVPPADLAESARQPGLVYELTFTADRAVRGVTWSGEARPQITAGAGLFENTTRVRLEHAPEGAPVATGCGGD